MPVATTGTPVTRRLSSRGHEQEPVGGDPEDGRHGLGASSRAGPETGRRRPGARSRRGRATARAADLRERAEAASEREPEPDGERRREARATIRRRDWQDRRPRRAGARRRARVLEVRLERGDDSRVELRARVAPELGERLLGARSVAVAPLGRDRVVRVGDEDDARAERDLLAREPVRVARAVPVLVVVLDPDVDGADVHAVEERRAELGMVRELPLLVRSQGARLLEHPVGDRDLAEVVETTGELELLDLLVLELQPPGDRLDEQRDALGVRARVLVLRVDDADEVLGGAQPRLVLDSPLELGRRRAPRRRTGCTRRSGSSRSASPSRARCRRALEALDVARVVADRSRYRR